MMILRAFLVFFTLLAHSEGQDFIAADFSTSEGDFTVELDYLQAPLAVSNFIHLAGKGDDIFETPDNVPILTSAAHYRQSFYRTIAESDTQRLPLRVDLIPESTEASAFYGVFQGGTFIGGVDVDLVDQPFHQDITGQDRIRLELVSGSPLRYRITLRYPRPWLDARDLRVRPAPMYQGLRINRVETGRRFFAGSVTRNPFENPGYEFQDEVLRNVGSLTNPFGNPFNSAWVIAMDSVGPNRNGSRFFITSAADRSLNGRHTAFGIVRQDIGRSVVASITSVGTDADDNPSREMFIENITIRRRGLTAIGFFEGVFQASLPSPPNEVRLEIQRDGSTFLLTRPSRPGSQLTIFSSLDLVDYSGGLVLSQSPGSLEALFTDLTPTVAALPRLFLRGFSSDLPSWPSENFDVNNARLRFNVTSEGGLGSLNLTVLGGDGENVQGSYEIDTLVGVTGPDGVARVEESRGAGTFSAVYDPSQGPYRGVFTFANVTGPLNVDELTLHFDFNRFAQDPSVQQSLIIRRFEARRTDSESGLLSYDGLYRSFQ